MLNYQRVFDRTVFHVFPFLHGYHVTTIPINTQKTLFVHHMTFDDIWACP